jgi:hypothetical protein
MYDNDQETTRHDMMEYIDTSIDIHTRALLLFIYRYRYLSIYIYLSIYLSIYIDIVRYDDDGGPD